MISTAVLETCRYIRKKNRASSWLLTRIRTEMHGQQNIIRTEMHGQQNIIFFFVYKCSGNKYSPSPVQQLQIRVQEI